VERQDVVPFLCEICGGPFHELEGGRCSGCGKMVCREHLHMGVSPHAYLCSECDGTAREVDL
jgi:hypothetical protein